MKTDKTVIIVKETPGEKSPMKMRLLADMLADMAKTADNKGFEEYLAKKREAMKP